MGTELRHVVRSLRSRPGFTAVVLVTFALGIGATTALSSVVGHVLLKPLPYPDPDRLVQVWTRMPDAGIPELPAGHAEYLDYRSESRLLEDAGAYWVQPAILTEAGEPARIAVARTTVSLWSVLGVAPSLGRPLVTGDDQGGAAPVAVLSHGMWQGRFGADPGVVGSAVRLDGHEYRVVGVMPPTFAFPSPEVEVWTPITLDPLRRDNHHLSVLARMAEGVTVDQLQPEMDAIVERWSTLYDHAHPMFARLYRDQLLGQVRRPLGLLFGAVTVVLLIAAFNVAGLLLARSEARQRELAVRAALGGSRRSLVRSLLGETLALAALGGVLGLVVAKVALALLVALEPGNVPRLEEVGLEAPVLLASAAITLLAGLLAGVVPALRFSRPDLSAILRGSGERTASAAGRQRLRSALVVAQTAAAVVLVTGAALLLRSLWSLQLVDPGLRTDHLLTAQISLPATSYPTPQEVLSFYERLVERLQAVPGVTSAGLVNSLPLRDSIRMILVGGPWQAPDAEPVGADVVMVSSDCLRALGNPVLRGRPFDEQDRPGGARVAAVNETAARHFFGDRDPLGQPLRIRQATPPEQTFEVVAVVRDVPTAGLGTDVRPQVYLPLPQALTEIRGVTRSVSVVLRTAVDPASLGTTLRTAIWELDDQLAISSVETMDQVVASSLSPQRFQAALLVAFSLLALLLAAVGLYGLMAHLVGLRRRELGIRLAMGATPGKLLSSVLGQAMALAGLGVVFGLIGALLGARVMESMVFGVAARDPASLLATAAVLLAAAAAASAIPAWRASRVNPLEVLRGE